MQARAWLIPLAAVFFVVFAASGQARADPIAHLTLQSEAGDFVGQGGSFDLTYTPANSDFFLASVVPLSPAPSFVDFLLGTVTGGPDDTFVALSFSTTALNIALAPGLYSDAERALFASPGHPGLDVAFQGRGCNSLTGSFTVDEATFSPDGSTINTFSAAFEQHCEGASAALIGTFTFDAGSSIPEPGVAALVAVALTALSRRGRRPGRRRRLRVRNWS
jgi:hypothetical protein